MGRKAKLRAQRRQADEPSRRSNPAALRAKQSPAATLSEFDQAEVAATISGSNPESSDDSPSLLQRILPFLKRNKQETLAQSAMEVYEFFDTYQALLGAIAWHGYKTQGRGYILAIPTPQNTLALRYVSRKTLKQYTEPEERPVCRQLIESYDPQTEVTLILMASTGDIRLMSPQATDPPPPQAYKQWKEGDSQDLLISATDAEA